MTAESTQLIEVCVSRRCHEAQDIVSFELTPAAGGSLPPFSAGAHIDVHTPAGVIRQYSLCNEFAAGIAHYRIAVLRDAASRGGSTSLHAQAREGARLLISQPRNLFPLVGGDSSSLLLAGGIGITPILCMAQRLARIQAPFQMHYCTRSRARTAFFEEIKSSSFGSQVEFHFDDAPREQQLNISAALANPTAGRHLYVCGPRGFLDAVRASAAQNGWPENRVHFEYFGAVATDAAPSGSFEVELAGSGAVYSVPPDKSIVEVLAQHGITVPVSCEQGICGTCITRVLGGIPDHRDSIFTDAEKAANNQLTPCCSRSLSPRLVLDL